MDKRTLVEKDFREGALLVKELDNANFPVHAALWLYDLDRECWRLIIASKSYDHTGPAKAYRSINDVLMELRQNNQDYNIDLSNIVFVRTNDRLIEILSTTIHTGPDKVAGIRFSRNAIENYYIEDAYIYRIA
ncbi:hypothetical protein [Ornithinibacillus halophilus]|uniref:Uncharacterized protein n=1 Tax=Ornithinibacillus halophilus TaxID=930117 RepID=A0A1M5GSC7_9BACI|nr:hypothetical protein [Ornithinibacillus halophilus]SHG06523.1 hypothetical protein SAMN05216225_101433 [Ornithinibacillus halophilus]